MQTPVKENHIRSAAEKEKVHKSHARGQAGVPAGAPTYREGDESFPTLESAVPALGLSHAHTYSS